MRKLDLWLALGLVVACGSPPGEVTSEATTTEATPTTGSPTSSTPDDTTAGSGVATTMSASTGDEVCPPMPPEDGSYDPCPGLCGGGGQCFNDGAEYAVCTRGCFMDCNCWPAPEGDGDAPVRCSDELLESTSVCVLDCSGGRSCPRGMFCVPELEICAFPFPGSDPTTSSGGSTDESTSSGGSTDESTSSGGSTDTGTSSGGSTDTGTSTDTGGSTGTGTSTGAGSTDTGTSTGGATGTSTT